MQAEALAASKAMPRARAMCVFRSVILGRTSSKFTKAGASPKRASRVIQDIPRPAKRVRL
jgi:hypothetical protein